MRKRLGEASELIEDDNYLPMFRNRQINYPEEFVQSVITAKKKKEPGRYLATIWKKSNIRESLIMLRKLINTAIAEVAHKIHKKAKQIKSEWETQVFNKPGHNRLKQLKRDYNLLH